jgi:hypothetical protein
MLAPNSLCKSFIGPHISYFCLILYKSTKYAVCIILSEKFLLDVPKRMMTLAFIKCLRQKIKLLEMNSLLHKLENSYNIDFHDLNDP